jgi:hypothetical protein
MPDLVASALAATRESRQIEFKESFDPNSSGDWCELIKDIAAIANSGGGIILFGVNSQGRPPGTLGKSILDVDPADITNRIFKYTGSADFDVEIRELQKGGSSLCAFVITATPVPLVFARPGTYDAGGGKQKVAFGVGTVYFRHGSKSEPGTTDDLRALISRRVDRLRKEWAKAVRKVVQAPAGSQVLVVRPGKQGGTAPSGNIRLTNDPDAMPVVLTRDTSRTDGILVREELLDGIFDEINNVVDANRALAKGERRFVLGADIYYRIYAERQHVDQGSGHGSILLGAAVTEMYAPSLFWVGDMSDADVAATYAELFLRPRSPQVHAILRVAVLLGSEFCTWLLGKWKVKWERHSQPPAFYWTFQQLCEEMNDADYRAVAARLGPGKLIECSGEQPVAVSGLLKNEDAASALLSRTCLRVFEGHREQRSIARDLDYIAYGRSVRERSQGLAKAIISAVGNAGPGDFANPASATSTSGAPDAG